MRLPLRPGRIPKLLTSRRIVRVELVASHHDHDLPAVNGSQDRCGVRVARFALGVGHARGFPDFAAALQIVGDDIAGTQRVGQPGERVLHAHRDDDLAGDHRAVGMAPPDRVSAVVRLQIALPKFLAGEIKHRQIAIAEMKDDILAVGGWRRASHILHGVKHLLAALVVLFDAQRHAAWLARADRARPFDGARAAIEPHGQQVFVFLAGDKEGVFPDGGRAIAPLGQFGLPSDADFFVPGDRKIGLLASAVTARAAPGRPIFGRGHGTKR